MQHGSWSHSIGFQSSLLQSNTDWRPFLCRWSIAGSPSFLSSTRISLLRGNLSAFLVLWSCDRNRWSLFDQCRTRPEKSTSGARFGKRARVCIFCAAGSAIISIGYALQKYLLHGTTPWEVFFWGRVASFLAVGIACAFSGRLRREVHEGVFSASAGTLTFAAGVEWVNFTGVLLLIIAYAHGPMTLVTVAAASQPIFVIAGSAILAWLGFRSRPVSVRSGLLTIAVRTLGAICLLVGLYWMYKQV